MRLGDRDRERRAVDLAGRGVDDSRRAVGAGGLEDVQRARRVRREVRLGCLVRVGDGDQCGQVADGVDVRR